MPTTLLSLHGFTMSGPVMKEHLAELGKRFPANLEVVYPSAPHPCSDASVERLYGATKAERLPGPHFAWWDATDDGREYRGWEATRDALRALLERHSPAGILGFSQGAILAAAVAALSAHGEMPPLEFVILVAGRIPRADVFRPFFGGPIAIPSLHVWGDADPLASGSGELAACFDEATRDVVRWPGSHRVPSRGPGADAIVGFLERHRLPKTRPIA